MADIRPVECPYCHYVNHIDLEELAQRQGVFYRAREASRCTIRVYCSNCGRSFAVDLPPEVGDEPKR